MEKTAALANPANWLPVGSATVSVLGIVGQLFDQVAAVVVAAGAELLTEVPAGASALAIVVGVEALADRRQSGAVLSGQSCPVVLVGGNEEESTLWTVAAQHGIRHVVPLPHGAVWLAEFLNELQNRTERGGVLAIVGGCGGAGASTMAALLAARAAREKIRTLLIDGDRWGFGIEGSLAPEPPDGLRWQDLLQSSGTLNAHQFAAALPEAATCAVLGFGRLRGAGAEQLPATFSVAQAGLINQAVEAARKSFELVVIDAGRSGENIELFCGQADQVLCLLPATVPAMLALRRMLPILPRNTKLVTRRPYPEGLDGELIAESVGLPLLGEMPRLRGAVTAAAQGRLSDCAAHRGLAKLLHQCLATLKTGNRL